MHHTACGLGQPKPFCIIRICSCLSVYNDTCQSSSVEPGERIPFPIIVAQGISVGVVAYPLPIVPGQQISPVCVSVSVVYRRLIRHCTIIIHGLGLADNIAGFLIGSVHVKY